MCVCVCVCVDKVLHLLYRFCDTSISDQFRAVCEHVYKERTMMNDFMRSRVADGRAGREAMLARRRFDICVALCGVCVASGYSVAITLGAHRPASAISSSNSDSSGNVSLHNSIQQHTHTHV